MTLYMHTLDGQPACFYRNNGICFAHKGIKLATSLRQIRREQAEDFRIRAGYVSGSNFKHGYVTIASPSGDRDAT